MKVPTSYFTAPVHRLIWHLSGVAVGSLVLVLWLGSWFASTISRPIVELNQIFRRGPKAISRCGRR